jgi:GT2 family glycosyltransferase
VSVRCAVVVATRDRPASLERVLTALRSQTHPAGLLEVIVVDDGSSAALRTHDLGPEDQEPTVKLIRCGGGGPAAARNAGAARASACDLILFTDDDAVPAETWVEEMAAAHAEDPEAALGGPTVPIAPRNPYSATYQAIDDASRVAHGRSGLSHFAAANLALPPDRFAELGGFDPAFRVSEDRELCGRWLARGWPTRFLESAMVAHSHPETLRGFWSTFVGYGRGAQMFHRKLQGGRHSDTGWRISVSTLSEAVSRSRSPRRLALVAVWLLATLVGFTQGAAASALRSRRPNEPSP